MSSTVETMGGRIQPYDRGLRLGSALHVATSLTGLAGRGARPYVPAAPRAGAEEKDELQSQFVVHGQPLPQQGSQSPMLWQQAATILTARPRERTRHNVIIIRPARSHHDGVTGRGVRDGTSQLYPTYRRPHDLRSTEHDAWE
jgi:hypothetical protein